MPDMKMETLHVMWVLRFAPLLKDTTEKLFGKFMNELNVQTLKKYSDLVLYCWVICERWIKKRLT